MARIIESAGTNAVGSRVKKYRIANKMSQQVLSARLELHGVYVCRGSVSRIEDHQRTVTDMELYALSRVLGVPLDELYEPSFLANFEKF